MLAGAKQEGTSDVAYSRNQPSVLEDDREPQRQSGARSGAPQTSNPRRIADFRRSRVCDSRIHKLARTIDYVFGPAQDDARSTSSPPRTDHELAGTVGYVLGSTQNDTGSIQ